MVRDVRQTEYKETKTLILDGIPRTLNQAEMLKQYLKIDVVLSLMIREDILVEVLKGRRTCPKCNRTYHLSYIDRDDYYMPNRLPEKRID